MLFQELSQTALVRFLGLLLFFRILWHVLFYIYDFIKTKYFSSDITTLGAWAVITGATDGIGKALAHELAKKGINILLISRSEEKLKDTAREIENASKVKTSYIQADFGDRNCYKKIREEINNYDIGILVNNVGIMISSPQDFTSLSEDYLMKEIDVNCTSAVIMTRLVLPNMKAKNKGLIVNVSSLSTESGFPAMGLYGATKAFLNMFSYNIGEEVSNLNIRIHCIIPGPVKTKILQKVNSEISGANDWMPSFLQFYVDPSKYAESVVKHFTSSYTIYTGYFPHSIMALETWLPFELRLKVSKHLLDFLRRSVKHREEKRKLTD